MSGVQSIERAFALLRALSVGPAGVTDLAERCDLPKSTVARLLGALEGEGAVEQVVSWGEYRLGPAIIDMAGAAAPGHNVISAARPHLWELTEATGETSGVAVLDHEQVVYLDHVESTEEVQVRSWTGERVAPHLVPSGLLLLAHEPESRVEAYLSRPLEAATERSVVDVDHIRQRLHLARQATTMWIYGEFDAGINSVAAPVHDELGQVVAALHIHGPAYRFPADGESEKVAAALADAAERLSAQLGRPDPAESRSS